jgi:hypothetical protein
MFFHHGRGRCDTERAAPPWLSMLPWKVQLCAIAAERPSSLPADEGCKRSGTDLMRLTRYTSAFRTVDRIINTTQKHLQPLLNQTISLLHPPDILLRHRMPYETTLGRPVEVQGIGLHHGAPVTLTIRLLTQFPRPDEVRRGRRAERRNPLLNGVRRGRRGGRRFLADPALR